MKRKVAVRTRRREIMTRCRFAMVKSIDGEVVTSAVMGCLKLSSVGNLGTDHCYPGTGLFLRFENRSKISLSTSK